MRKIMLFFLLIGLFSCKNQEEYNKINRYDIFEINREKYYILIYLNGCMACRDVRNRINHMDKNLYDIFYYDNLEENKELMSTTFVSNVNIDNYQDIKVKKTPTLFLIENHMIVSEWVKSSVILSYFNELEK